MKWMLGALGVLALIVVVIAVVGFFLPREHVASTTARIEAPPDSVWQALIDVRNYPKWRPDVKSVEVLQSSGPLRWREHTSDGVITFERGDEQRPRRLVGRIADESLPFGGTWTYELVPDASGTRLTITEDGFVSNPIFRFMARFVFGHHGTQERFQRALGRRFGHDVEIVRD